MHASLQLLSEQLLSLSQAARRIPPYRGGRTNPSTIFRWLTVGVKLPGDVTLKLEGVRLAGRWLTSSEALDRFLAAQNEACNPIATASSTHSIRTPNQRQRACARAGRELEKLGI